jgi:hypothetical protein
MSIALVTRQAEILNIIRTPMFYGNDVIDMKGNGASGCGQSTVFTTVARAIPNDLPLHPGNCHSDALLSFNLILAFSSDIISSTRTKSSISSRSISLN